MPKVKMDGRRKLDASEHEYIRKRYKDGESQRELARAYGVSRRLITFILNPEKYKAMVEKNRKEQHWKTYYNRKQLTEAVKKWRSKLKENPETLKELRDYEHKENKKEWEKKKQNPQKCPICGKTRADMRNHIREVHEKKGQFISNN